MDDKLLTAVPMKVQDIAKEVLDNKAAKGPEDDIPDKEEEEDPDPQYSTLPFACWWTTPSP